MKVAGRAITEHDFKLLSVFKAVVENGGFSAAEDELGITRSTISVHMSSLETRLKLTLCQRGRAGFALTPDGQQVYRAFLLLCEAMGEFSYSVSKLTHQVKGSLVVLHSDTLDQTRIKLLSETIESVRLQAPEITITLDGDRIENIEKALLNDKAHVGLFPDYRKIAGLEYEAAFSEPIYLCCSQSHPLFSQPDEAICDAVLKGFDAVVPGVEVSPKGRSQLMKLSPAASAYQFDSRKALIASGKYIGYLPKTQIEYELQANTFRVIQPQTYCYPFSQSLVSKRPPAEPNKVKLFRSAIKKRYADYPELTNWQYQKEQ